jgi:hypothetical protein
MGERTLGEPDLEPIDLTDPTVPLPRTSRRRRRKRPLPRRESSRGDSRPRLFIVTSVVAVLSASAAVVATLTLTHRTLDSHSVAHETTKIPAPTTTSASTAALDHPYETRFDGWTVAPDLDPPAPGMVPGSVHFSLVDRYQGRPAGHGEKWLVVSVTITNNQASARPFAAEMVELNAYELKLYAMDPTGLAQFRNAVRARASVRRVLLFRVPASTSGMFLVFRPDWMGAMNRGQAGQLDLNCC